MDGSAIPNSMGSKSKNETYNQHETRLVPWNRL